MLCKTHYQRLFIVLLLASDDAGCRSMRGAAHQQLTNCLRQQFALVEINTPEKQEHRTHLGIAMSHLVFFPRPITAVQLNQSFCGLTTAHSISTNISI
jgi:hypothetical protein